MTDEEMAAHLGRRGYLVAKIPPCSRQGRGHGRHTLITRSGVCDGEEPMPHAFANLHQGSFGLWVYCACGHGFADYRLDDSDEPTPWEQHKAEHGITVREKNTTEGGQAWTAPLTSTAGTVNGTSPMRTSTPTPTRGTPSPAETRGGIAWSQR